MMTASRLRLVLGGVVLFLAGALVGYFGIHGGGHSYESIRDTTSGYEYIAPLLFVEIDEQQSFPEYAHLKSAMERFVNEAKSDGRAKDVSMYFRNLRTSQWVGVNADHRYTPASMLKVATLMATLDAAEDDGQLLTRRVKVGNTGDELQAQDAYPPSDPLRPGSVHTVQDLIERLIQQSDNIANAALGSIAGNARLAHVYEDLQLTHPEVGSKEGYTAQEYSRLYRALYNSTYLSRPYSEYALSLLATTEFTKGLVAGVPEGTRVSHKFGVHTLMERGIEQELHDCGIVYFPGRPYFICVMTRGTDFAELEGVLAGASRTVWDEVSALDAR